jgi:hypothetical protein
VDGFAGVATFVTVVDGFGLVCNAFNGFNSFLDGFGGSCDALKGSDLFVNGFGRGCNDLGVIWARFQCFENLRLVCGRIGGCCDL